MSARHGCTPNPLGSCERVETATEVDSPIAWRRLAVAVVLGTIGGVGMWSMPVTLPAVQADFGVARGDASLPFTLAMMGFAFGGVVMGRLSDRLGILAPVICWDGDRCASVISPPASRPVSRYLRLRTSSSASARRRRSGR